jgi:acetylxylan esterase
MLGGIRFYCLAIFAIASGLFLQQVNGQSVPSGRCATGVHAIMARGQAATGETGFDPLNVMISLQDFILKQIPGSTSLGLPYQYGAQDKFVAVHDGAQMLQNYVSSYVASCPKSRIVVVGYSLVSQDILRGRGRRLNLRPIRELVSQWMQFVEHPLLD